MSKPNRLAREGSPYLLQHAENPVDWYPWGDEAFKAAKTQQKPIFLSIGYSTCHWCHVMERESFEDETIAAKLNELFINIKVDREERPDVDRVYMTYVQAVSGSGGWPMSVWLTPDLEPFFGGTYFPPDDQYGRPGFGTLIDELASAWSAEPERVRKTGQTAIGQLQSMLARATFSAKAPSPDDETLDRGFEAFLRGFDATDGGFGQAPKFPRPVTYGFLLRYFARTKKREAADMVITTLDKMALGGMADQLGGGFHRYSVDRYWHVPHFEKMLYDQAQLLTSYVEGYQLTGNERFAKTARGIIDYVLRDLMDPSCGGFYSAEDADSFPSAAGQALATKREGAFYVWSHDELTRILGDDSQRFCEFFGCTEEGNADDPHGELTGLNVLHAKGWPAAPLESELEKNKATLLAHRNQRPRPHLDDKVLCCWNGLMIAALARAARAFDEPRYLAAAQRALDFLLATLWDKDRRELSRRYRKGEVAFEACLEDYAQLIDALIEVYQAGFAVEHLLMAEALQDRQNELFWDEQKGAFYSSSGRDASILLRMHEDYDGAEPSGNSTSVLNLLRLTRLLDRPDYDQRAARILHFASHQLSRAPTVMPQMLTALELQRHPPTEIVIAAERDDDALRPFLRAIDEGFIANKVVLLADAKTREQLGARLPHLTAMQSADGPRVYLCKNKVCEVPLEDPQALRARLAPAKIALLHRGVG
jgi:uncharacterized protein YyaL (SSP411 family)